MRLLVILVWMCANLSSISVRSSWQVACLQYLFIILNDMYFQKYHQNHQDSNTNSQSPTNNPPTTNPLTTNSFPSNPSTNNQQGKQFRQSYLKAFKKHYIERILQEKTNQLHPHQQKPLKEMSGKENLSRKGKIQIAGKNKSAEKQPDRTDSKYPLRPVNEAFEHIQLQELLYSSISQFEKDVFQDSSALGKRSSLQEENKILKQSISKLKTLLKDKLQIALKRNKEELTDMFEEYSSLIKKLLKDKETLTVELENANDELMRQRADMSSVVDDYERSIEQYRENEKMIQRQMEQFVEIIVQNEEDIEERANLKERVDELEKQNSKHLQHISKLEKKRNQFEQAKMENISVKIEQLLEINLKLQTKNDELNQRLGRIYQSRGSMGSVESQPEQEGERALRKIIEMKDQCIERLNLIILELKNARYESVDRFIQQHQ